VYPRKLPAHVVQTSGTDDFLISFRQYATCQLSNGCRHGVSDFVAHHLLGDKARSSGLQHTNTVSAAKTEALVCQAETLLYGTHLTHNQGALEIP